jgi:hypothetical protein
VSTWLAVVLIVEPLVLTGTLGFTAYHLVKLERGLKDDLAQALQTMGGEHRQHTRDLRTAQREHVQAVAERLDGIDVSLAWMVPWVRYWVALHQQQAQEFPA